jgi:hypothetical protein
MNQITSGVVEKVMFKEGTGPRGPWRKGSILIKDAWYGAFEDRKAPTSYTFWNNVREGVYVEIEYTSDGKFNNLVAGKIVENIKNNPVAAKEVALVMDKDARITYLACQRSAIDLVNAMLAAQAISLGTKKKAEAYYAFVELYANKLASAAWKITPAAFAEPNVAEEVVDAAGQE